MIARRALIGGLLGIAACVGAAHANSCSNLDVIGTFDESGLRENESGIYAAGTFRIEGEEDENKQPMFNLAIVNCEKLNDGGGKTSIECKVTKAVVWATADKPSPDKPNCSLDLESSAYSMKEFQKGILSGIETSSSCYNSFLTIDRNTNRIYLYFTRTPYADNFDKIRAGTCGSPPRSQVLMNCTAWPKIRKAGYMPPRYCDFSSSSSK